MTGVGPRHLFAAPLLAFLVLVASHCAIDPFCENGTVGCAADPCENQLRDGDETDVDCGGSCGPCLAGAACSAAADCISRRCFEGACCDPPCVVSARRFGGPDAQLITSAVYLSDGTLVIAGDMHGTVDFGGGPMVPLGGTDIFVAALESGGSLRWLRRFGGTKQDFGPRLAVMPNGHLFLAALYQSANLDTGAGVLPSSGSYADLFVVELDEGGNTVRAEGFVSTQGSAVGLADIAATPDGGLVIAGTLGRLDLGGVVLVSHGGGAAGSAVDVFVAKLDASLERVWQQKLGDGSNDYPFGVELNPAGDVVVGVLSATETSFGGPPLERPGASLVAFGGADGAYLWGRAYGASVGSSILSIDGEGNLFMAGGLGPEADFGTGKLTPRGEKSAFVGRFTGDGAPVWITQLPSDVDVYPLAVRRDPAGGIVAALGVTGNLDLGGIEHSTGADSLVFVRLTESGEVEWARSVGGIVLGMPVGLASGPSGLVMAYGGYAGSLDLGAVAAAEGKSDGFAATLLP